MCFLQVNDILQNLLLSMRPFSLCTYNFIEVLLGITNIKLIRGGVAQWVARLTRNVEVLG